MVYDTYWQLLNLREHVDCVSTVSQIIKPLYNTLNSVYNEKKYVEILLRYRRVFVKDDVQLYL